MYMVHHFREIWGVVVVVAGQEQLVIGNPQPGSKERLMPDASQLLFSSYPIQDPAQRIVPLTVVGFSSLINPMKKIL